MAETEIKSYESVANAACKSHVSSSIVQALCSVTEDSSCRSLFYSSWRSFNYNFLMVQIYRFNSQFMLYLSF